MSGRAAGAFFLILFASATALAGDGAAVSPGAAGLGGLGRTSGVGALQPAAPAELPPHRQSARLSWDWIGRPSAPGPAHAWQRRKSARVAMISSFLVPGLGQMYNEREFWAAVAAGVEFYFIGGWISEQRLTNRYRAMVNADPEDEEARVLFELHRDNRIQSTWMLALTMVISGLQAFVDAYLHDFDDSPLPLQLGATPSGAAGVVLGIRF